MKFSKILPALVLSLAALLSAAPSVADPLYVAIAGPTDVYFTSEWEGHQETWNALVGGGNGSYTYQWERTVRQAGSSHHTFVLWYSSDDYPNVDEYHLLSVSVSDSEGRTGYAERLVHVHTLCLFPYYPVYPFACPWW